MIMGEWTFLDFILGVFRHPLPWFCWIPALASFILSWTRDLRPYALGALVVTVQVTSLVVVLAAVVIMTGHTHCGCEMYLFTFTGVLPAIWLPVVALGIPVLLRVPREQFDRPFRRTALMTGVMVLDGTAASLVTFVLRAATCGYGHDWTRLFEWRP